MPPLSITSGWLAMGLVFSAAALPLAHRLRAGQRAAPSSRLVQTHVVVGLSTATFALGHTLTILPSLGSPAAVGGGSLALAPGALAFFLLFAHVGVGLQLRSPKLRRRQAKRRLHGAFAALILALVVVHAVALSAFGGPKDAAGDRAVSACMATAHPG